MNSYLETAIAVVLVVLIFSVITYIIQEIIAANLEFRGKMLKASIDQLLGTNTGMALANQFYDHPLIKKLHGNLTRIPSYISSNTFAIAILDLVAKQAPAPTGNLITDFKAGITTYAGNNQQLKEWLESLDTISNSVEELKINLETWYEEYMTRVTGWYKKKSTIITRIIAIIIVLVFNLDMIKLTTVIHKDADLKARLNTTANIIVDDQTYYRSLFGENIQTRIKKIEDGFAADLTDSLKKTEANIKLTAAKDSLFKTYTKIRIVEMDSLLNSIDKTGIPIGWKNVTKEDFTGNKWLWITVGWLLGTAAISMGAPFWFDLLVKLVNVRKTGLKPEGKP